MEGRWGCLTVNLCQDVNVGIVGANTRPIGIQNLICVAQEGDGKNVVAKTANVKDLKEIQQRSR